MTVMLGKRPWNSEGLARSPRVARSALVLSLLAAVTGCTGHKHGSTARPHERRVVSCDIDPDSEVG